jgi:hypothetical protein
MRAKYIVATAGLLILDIASAQGMSNSKAAHDATTAAETTTIETEG